MNEQLAQEIGRDDERRARVEIALEDQRETVLSILPDDRISCR
jgi:hypothetical protein